MRILRPGAVLLAAVFSSSASAADRSWENPVFDSAEQSVAAAKRNISRLGEDNPPGLRFFIDLTLAEGDLEGRHPSSGVAREVVDDLLITYPTAFSRSDVQRRTLERFRKAVPRQREILESRLARFGYPEMPGLVYCRLVESVDAFADLSAASSDRMTQVGGVTYYCRYVVLPLSYVGEANVRELNRSAAQNPSINVADTIRRWQRESFANLISTFRHEMVHVHTNTTLDVPSYSDRSAYPTWFHEGTATYLAADPHSGLSPGYQRYQETFFYLVQRYGVRKLQNFFSDIFGGSDVRSALESTYGISDSDQLFARSARWHRAKEFGKTAFWIAVLFIVAAAFRGGDRPYIGALQLVIFCALVLAVATGMAEHIFGLRGPRVVLLVKVAVVLAAVGIGSRGVRRIIRHRRRSAAS